MKYFLTRIIVYSLTMETQTLTMKIANSKYLEGDIDRQLEDLAKGYLHYLTWEHVFSSGETFLQIVEQDFAGNKDYAFQGFLYRAFRHIQIGKMANLLNWLLDKHILLLQEEASLFLFKIKMIVMTYSQEELKETIGLGDFDLK